MTIGWLLGWAVPEPWFRALAQEAFPEAQHVFAAAAPGALDRLEAAGPFDWLAGYSLGTLLLLSNPAQSERIGRRVALLAPIFAFPREALSGGRIPRAEILLLARRLRRDPVSALANFYTLAGLDLPADRGSLLPDAVYEGAKGGSLLPRAGPDLPSGDRDGGSLLPNGGSLFWGLERLERDAVAPRLPEGWRGWCGAGDGLLDAEMLHALEPGVGVVAGAGHHPRALMEVFARESAVGI